MGKHNERGSERERKESGKVKKRKRREWTAALSPCGDMQPTVFTGL